MGVTEDAVGITCFTNDCAGFQGILKHRCGARVGSDMHAPAGWQPGGSILWRRGLNPYLHRPLTSLHAAGILISS